jgi:hypothetical protein
MRRAAMPVATMGFFVLALVGAASGLTPFDCAWRGLVGAAVLYVVMTVAGHVVVTIVADAILSQAPHPSNAKDTSRERGN